MANTLTHLWQQLLQSVMFDAPASASASSSLSNHSVPTVNASLDADECMKPASSGVTPLMAAPGRADAASRISASPSRDSASAHTSAPSGAPTSPARGKRRRVLLSQSSHAPWVPTTWLASPPYLFYDVLYATLSCALTLALTRGTSSTSLSSPLSAPPSAWALSAAVGAAVFAAFRALPRVSHANLLHAEAVVCASLSSCACGGGGDAAECLCVREHWSNFKTASAEWHIHALQLTRVHAQPAGAPPRPAVLLLHGHSAGAAHWEAVFERIGEHADFYAIDLPGWGRSPMPPALDACTRTANSQGRIIELNNEMLAGWMEANNLNRVVILGHSFGGFLAVHFAKQYPGRVVQLILVAPAGFVTLMPEGGYAWGVYFKYMPPQRVARNTGRLGYAIFRGLYLTFTTEDRRFPDLYYQLAAATGYTGKGDHLAAHFVSFDASGGLWWTHPMLTDLMTLDMPVSLIWGQRDDIIPAVYAPLLHRIRPHTDLYIIKDALHNPAHNNAAAFCDAVADALLKYRGRERVTLRGRSATPGAYSDATADALLERDASVTRGSDPARMLYARLVDDGEHAGAGATLPLTEPPSLLRAALLQRHLGREAGDSSSIPDSPRSASSLRGDADDTDTAWSDEGSSGAPARLVMSPASSRSLRLPMPASPSTARRLSAHGSQTGVHDGVTGAFGHGRGFCRTCCRMVENHKSYWRCACAAWSFNGFVDAARTRAHFLALLAFLDELYVHGTFDARHSRTIVMYLKVQSPLPPPANVDGEGAAAAAGGARDVQDDALQAWTDSALATPRGGRRVQGEGVHRTGAGSSGIVFPASPSPSFERGEVFLL